MTHTLTSPDIPAAHTWDRAMRRGMLAYLLSRIFVLLGVGVGITAHAIRDRWDDKVPVQGPTAVIRALDAWDDFEAKPLHATCFVAADGRMRWQHVGYEPFMLPDFLLEEVRRLQATPENPECVWRH